MDGLPAFEPFMNLGLGGAFLLVMLILGWRYMKYLERKAETMPKGNPGTNSNLVKENIEAIRENTASLREMSTSLRTMADQAIEHYRQLQEHRRKVEH